jgi:hypothetical protein
MLASPIPKPQVVAGGSPCLILVSALLPLLQLDSTYYRTYPERLASWGYIVVRYDTGIIIQTDKNEVSCAAGLNADDVQQAYQ